MSAADEDDFTHYFNGVRRMRDRAEAAESRVVELEAQVAELAAERDEALAAIEKMVAWMRETSGTVSWISHGEKLLARAAERGVS